MRLLDICCKAGGASAGYAAAGFDVVGVDREPQPRYPYPFIQADLRDLDPAWIAAEFDAVAASPPCWAHSDLKHRTGRDYEDFIPETRTLLRATGLPYAIENVEGAPLEHPLVLCGTQFDGLRVLRHRLFESNVPLAAPRDHPPRHPLVYTLDKRKAHYGRLNEMTDYVQVTGGGNCTKKAASDAMGGLDWMTKDELNQAIPPAYTRHIGAALMAHLTARALPA